MLGDPGSAARIDTAWTVFGERLGSYLAELGADSLIICADTHRFCDKLTVALSKDRDIVDAVAHVPRSLLDARSETERVRLAYARWRASPSFASGTDLELRINGNGLPIARSVTTLLRDFGRIGHPSFLTLDATGAPAGWITGNEPETDPTTRVLGILGSATTDRLQRHARLRVLDDSVVEFSAVYSTNPAAMPGEIVLEFAECWPDIAFRIHTDYVIAIARVDCSPLIDEHLIRKAHMFVRFLDEAGSRLADRLLRSASRRP